MGLLTWLDATFDLRGRSRATILSEDLSWHLAEEAKKVFEITCSWRWAELGCTTHTPSLLWSEESSGSLRNGWHSSVS